MLLLLHLFVALVHLLFTNYRPIKLGNSEAVFARANLTLAAVTLTGTRVNYMYYYLIRESREIKPR